MSPLLMLVRVWIMLVLTSLVVAGDDDRAGSAVGKRVIAGVAENVTGPARAAMDALKGTSGKATTEATGDLAARRAGGFQRLGAEGLAAELKVVDGAAIDKADELAMRHGMAPVNDAVTAGKTVREAPSPRRGQSGSRRGEAYPPPSKAVAKDAANTAEVCAKRADVEDVFGQELAKINPQAYRRYLESACFPAGTLVLMADGSQRPIEQVSLGDWVATRPAMGVPDQRASARRVVETFRRTAPGLVLVALADGSTFTATPTHPVHRLGGGWTPAGDLHPGDVVAGLRTAMTVARVEVIAPTDPTPVFNLEVADTHTYFISGQPGTEPVWVHNFCVLPVELLLAATFRRSPCVQFDTFITQLEKLGLPVNVGDEVLAAFEAHERWKVGRKISCLITQRIPFASGPGLNTIGRGGFSGRVRNVFGLGGQGRVFQGHHLIDQEVTDLVPKLFEPRKLTINNQKVYLPGVSMDLHDLSNGIPLPTSPSQRAMLGRLMSPHSGYHSAYNKAQEEVCVKIYNAMDKGVKDAFARGDADGARGDADGAFAAVRQAERRMGEMQRLSRDALMNVNPGRLLPLYRSGSLATEQLTKDWITRLDGAMIP